MGYKPPRPMRSTFILIRIEDSPQGSEPNNQADHPKGILTSGYTGPIWRSIGSI